MIKIFLKKYNTLFKLQKNKGFTVLETLVAITILLIAIVGPMQIAAKSLYSAFYARDEITAYYLAQEGIEYVRALRDNEKFNSNNFWDPTSSFNNACKKSGSSDGCMINTTRDTSGNPIPGSQYASCSAGGSECDPLYLDNLSGSPTIGFYNYHTTGASYEKSKFTRTVEVSLSTNSSGVIDGMGITSTVKWVPGFLFNSPKTFVLKDKLTTWRDI